MERDLNNMDLWIKLMDLGKFFGCHQIPQRSFFYKDYQFPVCARCTGVAIGELISLALCKFKINIFISIFSILIMLIDWSLQYFKFLKSTNSRRLITGILGGFGYLNIVIYILKYLYKKIKITI